MVDANKAVNGKSQTSGFGDELPDRRRIEVRPAGKYPEISARRTGYQRPFIGLLIEIDDVIAAGKWPEKRDRKARDVAFALEYGAAGGLLPSAGRSVEPSVQDVYRPVWSELVGRGDVGKSAFEAVVETHDLEPLAAIPRDIEVSDRLDSLWRAGASCDEDANGENPDKPVHDVLCHSIADSTTAAGVPPRMTADDAISGGLTCRGTPLSSMAAPPATVRLSPVPSDHRDRRRMNHTVDVGRLGATCLILNPARGTIPMGKMRRKADLPEKVCLNCRRPFKWRRKWASVWQDVKYCSDRCRSQSKSLPTA